MVCTPCSCCGDMLTSIAAAKEHFKVKHPGTKVYGCNACPFKRVFGAWNSFRHHLTDAHKLPNHTLPDAPKLPLLDLCMGTESASPLGLANLHNIMDTENYTRDENVNPFSLENFVTVLHEQSDMLICKLYSKPGLPRCLVDFMISDFTAFLNGGFVKLLKDFAVHLCNNGNASNDEVATMEEMFDSLLQPFSYLSSEYLRLQHFENSGFYIRPKSYVIQTRIERVTTQDGIKLENRDVTGQYIPLREVLPKVFELPNLLENTLKYVEELNSEDTLLCNFVQSEVWKRKRARYGAQDIVLPLSVYYDEFEPNAALGPHCEKLGATYVNCPAIPPECQASLQNIHLALLCNGDDRKTYGNERVFKPLIEELQFLEREGVYVTKSDCEVVKVFFVTGVIIGDNLGLNAITGFVESFNANHPCRICRAPKTMMDTMLFEDLTFLRNKENYLDDVKLNDCYRTGVKELCVFDAIDSIEIPTDIAVDEFHDAAEGICHYTMVPVLKHFRDLDSTFLDKLNHRIYLLDYSTEGNNRPPSITLEVLRKNQKLKMTGAEMIIFVRLFGVLVGDLVREEDRYWQLYLLLNDIVSIITAKKLPRDIGPILSLKVKEHNQLYTELTMENLKPKHHNFTHYGRLLNLLGIFSSFSTIRHEAKHKSLKATSNVCSTRKNLPLTVAIKQQLELCYRLKSKQSTSPLFTVGSTTSVDVKNHPYFPLFVDVLPCSVDSNVLFAKWVEFKGTHYRPSMVLVIDISDRGLPLFGEVELILPMDEEPLFICSPICTLGYFSHIRGYEVEKEPPTTMWFSINPRALVDPHPLCYHKMASGEQVLVLKNFL